MKSSGSTAIASALLALSLSACATMPGELSTPPLAEAPKAAEPALKPAEVAPIPQITAVERPAPVYEPQPARLPEYVAAPVYTAEPAPVYEAAPVYETSPSPQYVETAPLAEASPARRAMTPIYDERELSQQTQVATKSAGIQSFERRRAAYRPGGSYAVPDALVRSRFTPTDAARIEQAALARLNPQIRYDGRYVKIGYPWGDVPETTGVCTDVVIRTYRSLGIDLQQLVHEDMRRAFPAYPSQRIYGLKRPDPNIDHRRVVNLEAFFERTRASLPVSDNPDNFRPGDIVTWRLSGTEPHIGIVVAERSPRTGNPMIVHNIGDGVRKEDILFLSPIIGHYRFAPDRNTTTASLAERPAPKTDG